MRFLWFFILLAGLCGPGFSHAASSAEPPPADIRNLAEKLAPLIKETPSLDLLERRASVKTKSKRPVDKNEPRSEIEESFSARAGEDLRLFGYNQIGKHLSKAPTGGLVQDDMIVGAGDTLLVTFRGQRDDSKTYRITAQGQLIIDELPPINAAGMTVGALRKTLEDETAKNILNSTVYLSMKELRQISVTILGEVKSPGAYTLSPFHTVLDALAAAKGVTRNGSLRNIRLVRGGKSSVFDFYPLLTEGSVDGSLALRDGDKIVVSVLGASLAVAGDVKRAGVFETTAAGDAFSFGELMALAGGVIRPGANRFVKFSLTAWGEEKVQDIFPGDAVSFTDGDVLMVTSGEPLRVNGVQLLGHVRVPGSRALNKAPNIRALFSGADPFKSGVYPLMGVIERTDGKTLATKLIAFSPVLARQGKESIPLTERDRVLVFSASDIETAMKQPHEDIFAIQEEESEDEIEPAAGSENPLLTENIVAFMRDHAATVTGAVRHEGLYPVAGKVSLNEFLAGAGGLNTTADGTTVEIMLANRQRDGKRYTIDLSKDRPDDIQIASRDRVVVTAAPTMAEEEGVMITGEVARPGRYDLRKGDTLLDLIERAGGITDTAFAKGTVFMRAAERKKQEEKFRAMARELDLAVAGFALKKESDGKHTEQIKIAQDIARDLRMAKGVGRISVEADPTVLRTQPEMAILLQSGDRIYVPRRSMTVAVAGEVLSPAILQFRAGQKGVDYIRQAGGITRYADDGRAFVVFPDGSAAPINANRRWNEVDTIPAGSTVVVPRDPDPLEFLDVTTAIGGMLSQLAISSVAIAEIKD